MFKIMSNDFENFFLGDSMISSFWNDNTTKPVNFADEDAKAYHLTIQAPGFKKEDISINVEGRTIKIKGTSSHDKVSNSLNYHFTPPKPIRHSNIEAHLEDGVLSLTIPKDEPESVKIDIN